MSDTNPERIDFLLTRYGQLTEKQSHYNTVIHRTFYLSLIFFGVVISAGSRFDIALKTASLFSGAAIIFVLLYYWTRSYQNGRNSVNNQKKSIIDELKYNDFSFYKLSGVKSIFPEYDVKKSKEREDWEQNKKTNRILRMYYLTISLLLFAFAFISIR